jgi:CRISPR-associated endonuclease/helicase Cas3
VDVARNYQVISQRGINVLVPYMDVLAPDSDEIALFDSLNEQLTRETRLTRAWIHDAKPLTVSIYRPRNDNGVWQYLEPAPLGRGEKADDWFIYTNPKDYDPLLGLNPQNEVDVWTV